MSQVRGKCGHLKASWDNHPRCFACSRCSFQSHCQICKLWPSSIWTLASNRRSYLQRKVAMDKKKMGMKGASSRDTVSKIVEGSNDIRQPGSGTVSRQSQSENSSQSKSTSGVNYRENRENLLTDTSRSTEATPVDPIGGSTTNVSADKRIGRSCDHVSRDDSSSCGQDSSESDRSPSRVSPTRSSQPQSKDWSLQHRFPGSVISAWVTGPVISAPVTGSGISTPITGPVISTPVTGQVISASISGPDISFPILSSVLFSRSPFFL